LAVTQREGGGKGKTAEHVGGGKEVTQKQIWGKREGPPCQKEKGKKEKALGHVSVARKKENYIPPLMRKKGPMKQEKKFLLLREGGKKKRKGRITIPFDRRDLTKMRFLRSKREGEARHDPGEEERRGKRQPTSLTACRTQEPQKGRKKGRIKAAWREKKKKGVESQLETRSDQAAGQPQARHKGEGEKPRKKKKEKRSRKRHKRRASTDAHSSGAEK